ncbi:TetR/AcrR family transcriptional regulator [Mycolicibacterium brisbanense]|uniref:Transcriptional regulator n=1 Tax=Mycolicibacterium brisbanense TaxID=146020 RepID=A0A100W774_9MYCO|nr:TetR/AcrR family transcriptional regulator [Mycolicibacterium brisbanense]MCV7162066.1 TetR/AcrR family transcriptional regulator [Mycolicibacterium brisbanense]GAS92877.1 transcriptional regulator [Mycolicibacterium brisbanense]
MPTVARRTQQQRREATTAALVAAARELFAREGYEATSLDAVAAAAGMTKGAVYHHFDSKRELFAATFEQVASDLAEIVGAAYARKRDSWRAFEAGCITFLEACLDPGVRQIMLLDAEAALGWERVRELESGMLTSSATAIARAIAEGRIARRDPAPLAQLLFGALCEAAMVVARASDQPTAQRAIVSEIRRMLGALEL